MPEKYSTITVLFKPENLEYRHPKINKDIEGRYKISGDYVRWAPGRPVYRHMYKKDYYIFWKDKRLGDHGWTLYSLNGGSKFRRLELDFYNFSSYLTGQ